MKKEELGDYLDFLYRQARKKAGDCPDAEDLVSETVLRAVRFLEGGGEIVNPAAWLSGTLRHVWNDRLRRKYRSPVFVELTDEMPLAAEDDGFTAFRESDEGEAVRREVNRLVSEYRRTVILYYWQGLSVAQIASRLGIPEGTVKSRLDSGRKKIRKGLENEMESTASERVPGEKIPETLLFSNAGVGGPALEVEGELLVQNILIEAYEKPLTLSELSRRLGVPTAYVEPVARRLLDGEFMAQTSGGLWYTDFLIYSPEDSEGDFDAQLAWAGEQFALIWPELEQMKEDMEKTAWWGALNVGQRHKALYHAALLSLQHFTLEYGGTAGDWKPYYKHKKWPGWLGWGYRFPAEYDFGEKSRRDAWRIIGGLRTSIANDIPGVKSVALMEFDTAFFDRTDPWRYGLAPWHAFKRLLWKAYRGEDPSSDRAIPTTSLEAVPRYIDYGLLARASDGSLVPDIPVLKNSEYNDLYERICCSGCAARIDRAVGEDFRSFVLSRGVRLPAHLKSVPDSLRFHEASSFIAMAVLKEAHRRGLFLADAPDPCPPVVAAWEE